MQQLIEKHAVGLLFGLMSIFLIGYIDMRNLVSRGLLKISVVEKKVDTVTTIATTTRTEQLLRTDEIESIRTLREIHPEFFKENGP